MGGEGVILFIPKPPAMVNFLFNKFTSNTKSPPHLGEGEGGVECLAYYPDFHQESDGFRINKQKTRRLTSF